MTEPIFNPADGPFNLPEIARILQVDYEAVRSAKRRLEAKPETRDKVKPLGDSRYPEYSAEVANFLARRIKTNSNRSTAAR